MAKILYSDFVKKLRAEGKPLIGKKPVYSSPAAEAMSKNINAFIAGDEEMLPEMLDFINSAREAQA